MQIVSSYKVRIAESNQKIARAFIDTLDLYRAAVDFFIALVLKRWDSVFVKEMPEQKQIKAMEQLCIRTKNRPDTPLQVSKLSATRSHSSRLRGGFVVYDAPRDMDKEQAWQCTWPSPGWKNLSSPVSQKHVCA